MFSIAEHEMEFLKHGRTESNNLRIFTVTTRPTP